MTWKDNLRKASWKGVEFWWKDASTTLDPFMVTHKYPQRQGGWSEPLGLGPDEFEIVGFVLGADYMERRDALIRVCKENSAGTLVHPTLGEKTVVLKPPVRFQESTAEGGVCRFTFTFVEEGENKSPTATVLSQDKVSGAAQAAGATVAQDFESDFQTMGLDLVEGDAARVLGDIASVVNRTFGGLSSLKTLLTNSLSVVRGGNVASSLSDAFSQTRSSGDGLAVVAGLTQLSAALPTSTGTAQQDVNAWALETLVRRQAAIAAAQRAAAGSYDSRDDALAARDQAVALLDQVRVDDATRGDTFTALTDLRAVTVNSLGEKAGTLASVRTIEIAAALPSVVLAYRELGDGARAGEIASRNPSQVWNPLFVPAGSGIEVLDD